MVRMGWRRRREMGKSKRHSEGIEKRMGRRGWKRGWREKIKQEAGKVRGGSKGGGGRDTEEEL